jgi:hypothetical protein
MQQLEVTSLNNLDDVLAQDRRARRCAIDYVAAMQ